MMCEHDMDHLPFTNQKYCRNCGKSEQEIDLEQQLAAANARVVELEKKSREAFISSSNAIGFYTAAKQGLLAHEESLIKRAESAEAQCAAMQAAINRYVLGHIELLGALKAALEDKP